MGISTSGFVLTDDLEDEGSLRSAKDVFFVLSIIENVLTELVRKYSNKEVPIFRDATSRLPIIECNPNSKYFSIRFRVNNENRMLMIHFDCDCDYSEYGSSKIIWSVNYWGMAEEIILSICEAMKSYGKVFYEANDCDGKVVEV